MQGLVTAVLSTSPLAQFPQRFKHVVSGLDKLAQQKRDEVGAKALPGLGKRSRLDLDDVEEQEPALETSERDGGSKAQPRHYRSSRIDTPSHPGIWYTCYRSSW